MESQKRSANWNETEKVVDEVTLEDSNTNYIDDKMPSTRDSDPAATANIVSQVSTPVSRPVPSQVERALKKKSITNLRRNKLKVADNNYEKKIFELAVEARNKEMKNAEEIHEIKKSILKIQKEYWKLKLKKEIDRI